MPRKAKMFWAPWVAFMTAMCLLVLAGSIMTTVVEAQPASVPYIDVTKVAPAIPPSAGKVPSDTPRAAQATKAPADAAAPAPAPSGAPAASQAVAPVKPDDPKGAAEVLRGAMHTSNWRLVVLAGLLLAVLLLRKMGGWFLPAKAGAWVQSDRGGAALALAAGVLTVAVNGLVAGKGADPQLLIDGVLAAATAAGTFNLTKKLAKPSDKPAAQ